MSQGGGGRRPWPSSPPPPLRLVWSLQASSWSNASGRYGPNWDHPAHARTVPGPTGVGEIRRWPRTCRCPRRSVPAARRKRPSGRPSRHPGRGREPSPAGGGRGVEGCHRPQCRRIFSITSPCGGSMKAITFIWPPHFGQASGSISYTRLMSMAQVWLRGGQGRHPAMPSPGTEPRPLPSTGEGRSSRPRRPPCGAGRGPCWSTSRSSGSDARPWAECAG